MNETTIEEARPNDPIDHRHYAGFWIRVAAHLLDSLFLCGTSMLIFQPLRHSLGFSGALFSLIDLLEIAFGFLYICLLTWWSGQTLGKMVTGIRVIPAGNTRGTLSVGQVLLREIIGKILSFLPFGLGYFWVGWNKRKQGWHDMIAKTYVIRERGST